MSRLTKLDSDITKVKGTYMPYDERPIITLSNATYVQCLLNKLGKLEDLEEQLGCPLEVVVKALNMIIIYKVDVRQVMNCDTVDDYNSSGWFSSRMKLNNEQFIFLKGVFEKWIKS